MGQACPGSRRPPCPASEVDASLVACYLEIASRSHKALIAADADGAILLMRTVGTDHVLTTYRKAA